MESAALGPTLLAPAPTTLLEGHCNQHNFSHTSSLLHQNTMPQLTYLKISALSVLDNRKQTQVSCWSLLIMSKLPLGKKKLASPPATVMAAMGRLRQEDGSEFQAGLGYTMSSKPTTMGELMDGQSLPAGLGFSFPTPWVWQVGAWPCG